MTTFKRIYAVLTLAERKEAGSLLGLAVISMVLETLGIGLVLPMIAMLIRRDLAPSYPQFRPILDALGNPSQPRLIIMGMAALLLLYVFKSAFLAYFAYRQNRFTNDTKAAISLRLFTVYLRQPYVFHLSRNSSLLIRNVIGDASAFMGVLTHAVNLITEGVVLISVAVLLVLVEPVGTIAVVILLSAAGWAFHYYTRLHVTRWGKARHFHEALLMQHLQQGLGSVKDVKLLGREGDFLAQFHTHNIQATRAAELQMTVGQLPRLWLELLAVLGLVTLVITMLVQQRDVSGIVPALGLFAAAAFRVMPSVGRVLGAVQGLRYGLPTIDTIHEELKRSVPEPDTLGKAPGRVFQREVCLTDVTYTYPGALAPALDGVSLSILKGETVGFVGSSGAGKSTLVDVILGLLTPEAGRVAVDGQDVHDNPRSWQSQIGYVPQTIYLTDDTLRRNVAFGLSEDLIDDAAVERAINAAQLKEFVASLPDALETSVGERGVRLSGGQRQRIGIARALYHDPAVLVLDEATSALDTETERGVMDAVTALHGTKTILIVAHRLSTVEHCDRLCRLEQGRLEEEGAPKATRAGRPD